MRVAVLFAGLLDFACALLCHRPGARALARRPSLQKRSRRALSLLFSSPSSAPGLSGGSVEEEEQEDTGCDAGEYADFCFLEDADLAVLAERGVLVKDGAVADVSKLSFALNVLEEAGGLDPSQQPGVRDDVVRFVNEERCMIPVKPVILTLKSIGHSINTYFSNAYFDEALLPATSANPITTDLNVMIASYGPDGRYRMHSDNSLLEDGKRRNFRAYTAILYANEGWTTTDGGELAIWPRSHDLDAQEDEEASKAALKASWPSRRLPGDAEEEVITVAPKAGRLVLFDSRLLHEVKVSNAQSRRAITCWLLRPYRR